MRRSPGRFCPTGKTPRSSNGSPDTLGGWRRWRHCDINSPERYKSPSNFADPKGTAYGGSAFSSHLQRKPLASSPIHKPHPQDGSGTKAADRLLTEAGQPCSATRPEDLGGAEYPSRTVLGSNGDVRIGGSDHHCRLESVSGDLSQGL